MLWRMRSRRPQAVCSNRGQRAFSSGRFGLNVYDKRLCFLSFKCCIWCNILKFKCSKKMWQKYSWLSGKRKIIRLDMIEYICEGLNITLKEFFDDKVFDNIEMKD